MSTKAKARGLVEDASLMKYSQLITHKSPEQSSLVLSPGTVPPLPAPASGSTHSLSSILQQSLRTQDRPLLQELLLSSSPQLMTNTITELSPSLTSDFLSLLQQFLIKDSQNSVRYAEWLGELVKRHLGVLGLNEANKGTIQRIRKWISKRQSHMEALKGIKSRIQGKTTQKQTPTVFAPVFQYNEERQAGKTEQLEGLDMQDRFEDFMDIEEDEI